MTFAIVPKGGNGICIAEVQASTIIWYAKCGAGNDQWTVDKLYEVPFRITKTFDVDLVDNRAFVIREGDQTCYLITSSAQISLPVRGEFLTVSPNGNLLAVGSSADLPYPKGSIRIYELSVDGVRREKIYKVYYNSTGKAALAREFVWSSNSEELAYAEAIPWSGLLWMKARLVALDVLNGKKRVLYQNIYPVYLYGWSSQNPIVAEEKKQ